MRELIEGAESATYTPTSDDNGKYLRAIATYTDGKGKDTSMSTSVAVVEVRTDNPPEFSETEDRQEIHCRRLGTCHRLARFRRHHRRYGR